MELLFYKGNEMLFHHRGGCFSFIVGIALLIGISHGVSKENSTSLIKEYVSYVEGVLGDAVSGKTSDDEKETSGLFHLPKLTWEENKEPSLSDGGPGAGSRDDDSHGSFIEGQTGNTEERTSDTAASEKPGESTSDLSMYYCYGQLSLDEQRLYRQVLYAIENRVKQPVSTLDTSVLTRIYTTVMADHPEIFYVEGVNYTITSVGGVATSLELEAKYTMTSEEVDAWREKVEETVQMILSAIPSDADEYMKAKLVYDYLVANTDYVEGADENQNILSVFFNHKSVCNGYAKAAALLYQRLGMPSSVITGQAAGGLHAWNFLRVNGAWYLLDVTWGETDATNAENSNASDGTLGFTRYDYFLLPTEWMNQDHTPDGDLPIPVCFETKDNYFVRNGLYLTEADVGTVGKQVSAAIKAGLPAVQFRTADRAVLEQLMAKLFTNHEIYDYLHGKSSIRYSTNEAENVLTIIF